MRSYDPVWRVSVVRRTGEAPVREAGPGGRSRRARVETRYIQEELRCERSLAAWP